jgi:hypothetical protein
MAWHAPGPTRHMAVPTCWASLRDGRDRNLHETSSANNKSSSDYFLFIKLTCHDAARRAAANHGDISARPNRFHLRRKNLAIIFIGFSAAPHIKPDKT